MAVLDIVVPVFNEAGCLEASIRRLRNYLDTCFPFSAVVTIADNASTDGTMEVATRLAAELAGVRVLHLDERGRGRALKRAWSESGADVVAYMDVDLSTGLEALLPLVAPLLSGHSDLAIGTRLSRSATVVRGPKRELISRSYNRLLRTLMRSRFSDAQCGFKAVRGALVPVLIPLVEDDGWFFDTELLLIAERNALRIHEVPVDWVDDTDSRVEVLHTALADIGGMWRVTKQFASGHSRIRPAGLAGTDPTAASTGGGRGAYLDQFTADAGRFARVGVPSTLVWLALFLGLRTTVGAVAANVVALSLSAIGNFGARRRLERGAATGNFRELELVAGGSWMAAVAATTLAVIGAAALSGGWLAETLAAMATGAVVSLGRFVVLRALVVRHSPSAADRVRTEMSRGGRASRT
jgi:glycosyltransferase involved in cell wall biosynthesis